MRYKQKLYGNFRKSLKKDSVDSTPSCSASSYLEWGCNGWSSSTFFGCQGKLHTKSHILESWVSNIEDLVLYFLEAKPIPDCLPMGFFIENLINYHLA